MSKHTFKIIDAHGQVGTGSIVITDTRYANSSVVDLQLLFDSGIFVLDDFDNPAIRAQGNAYEVNISEPQDHTSRLQIGAYTITEIDGTPHGTLSFFTKPVTITITSGV